MNKNKKLKIIAFLSITLVIASYFSISTLMGNEKVESYFSFLNPNQKLMIKKYIFPFAFISDQQREIDWNLKKINQRDDMIVDFKKDIVKLLLELETITKKTSKDIPLTKKTDLKLSNNKILERYKFEDGFYYGINLVQPGSGYIDFYEDNIFVLSGRGVLAYRKKIDDDEENFKQIKNNLDDFISIRQYEKHEWFSLKDILIFKDQVFVSYTEEIKENCWNTSILYGDINYENIQFKKFFSSKDCVHSIDNIDKEFNGHQSGGRITPFDDNHLLFSVGGYRNRYLVQDKKTINGKIIKINLISKDYEIVSMGHRNPQGLYYDKENNFILESEHGPRGGGELNLIDLTKTSEDIPNYGWPIVSYGEHYGGKNTVRNKKKYKKYPLHKSHTKYGFIEPLKDFTPSIGCSEIVKIGKNKYVLASLGRSTPGEKSLFFFELSDKKELVKFEQVKVFERVRDLRLKDNKLYLFMENTASIGVIDLDR
jgi:hypothetical protein